ncbi:acyl-CoA dehydrogenase family protein [Sulfobacillus harzensis]|uniref:Isovaleryl-CoA dehydrogenase n=1 Tax=Sulfobacillus harzensis TaxID=2729629 RepID=A0A7Y0Q390_9FIRM|nr:acyl-CoA dehydrogenase family protein [Sulfobacillus harzensis]NMP23312.1 isovaleryl-CoA dehydrogenase [Sulfobacillus harzensis]
MDIRFSSEHEAFRERVRAFLGEVLTEGWGTPTHPLPRSAQEQAEVGMWWERTVYEHGFAGLSWPREYGGQGLTWVEQVIFSEECARANAPAGVNGLGKGLLGPTLLVEGTEAQKKRFIPPLLAGEEIWCQGYSERNAGSDLASLNTRAVLEGDEWAITGQKIWTSNAHLADWCFVLARTDPTAPKHRGITFFLVPMHQPGVKVEPLVQLTGEAHFNSVTFDGARTPRENVVGPVNDGWRVANTILSFERGTTIIGRHAHYLREFETLLNAARQSLGENGPLARDSHYRQRLMQLWSEIEILRLHGYQVITQLQKRSRLGPEASMLKLYYSEMHKRLGELAMEVLGGAMPYVEGLESLAGGSLHRAFLWSRAETIFAGTSEIQKNVIAERVLGLPKDGRR